MKDETGPRKTASRIFNNTLAFIGGEFFYHLINFFTGILVARSLGSEAYGQFSFIFVYLSFFEVFVQFGLNSIVIRELTQNKTEAPRILGNAILLRLLLAGISLPLALFLIHALGYPLSVQQGVLAGSFQLFLTLRALYETVFRVHLLMIYPVLVNGLRSLINLGLVAVLAYARPGLIHFILVYLGSGLAGLGAMALLSRRLTRVTLSWDWSLIKKLIKESFPLALSGYLTLLYYRIDVLMLSRMKGFSAVGYYSAATRVTESLDIIASTLMISLFPLFSQAFKEDRQKFERLTAKAFRTLLLAGLPIALGGTLVAGDLISLLFGPEYQPSQATLVILLWYTFFNFLATLLVNVLIACGRQAVDAWISFFLVLGNSGMNFLLIPSYSHNGAALATVLTELFGTALMLTYMAKHPMIRLPLPRREAWNALKINALFFSVLTLLKIFFPIPVIGLIFVGMIIYALLLLGMRLVSLDEIKSYLNLK